MANGFECGKLTEQYLIRIPETLKFHLDKLSPEFKKSLNIEILKTMARIIHDSKFDPSLYLKD